MLISKRKMIKFKRMTALGEAWWKKLTKYIINILICIMDNFLPKKMIQVF